ncbi:MAG: hypothetical protein A2046_13070 [Bacteroidetes bacterium GWA2_30_7]|nr:MAG: hypothetical protein A2046_13070 [Bacteroidetes bacterium GWA2_30_7]
MRIFFIVLRILLGSVFVLSAITKLFPIESFELSIVESGLISWSLAPYLARLFIGFECVLGIFIIFNFKIRVILKIATGLLIFFSIYLLYIWIKNGDNADCGCFGEFIKLNLKESILKNLILFGLSFYLLFKAKNFNWRFQKIIIPLLILIIMVLPFILNVINLNKYSTIYTKNINYTLDFKTLGDFNYNNINYKLDEGKKIVCFFSLSCKFCKLAAKKITIINNKLNEKLPIYYIFGGSKKYLEEFWQESNSKKFPYLLLEPSAENNKIFFDLSGPILPSIYYVDNGIVKRKVHFDDLEQSDIENFLNK